MSLSIYIASAYAENKAADALAREILALGHTVTSTWHVQRPLMPVKDPPNLAAKELIWATNKAEIDEATHLVFLERGRPRAAYAELGHFIRRCEVECSLKRLSGCVYWVGYSKDSPVVVGDPLVRLFSDVAALLDHLGAT